MTTDMADPAALFTRLLSDAPPRATWRDAEADVLRALRLLLAGVTCPPRDIADTAVLRRLGYLASIAPSVGTGDAEALTTYADAVAAAVAVSRAAPVPLIPGDRPRRHPSHDDVAARWHLSAGLDLARARSELPHLT